MRRATDATGHKIASAYGYATQHKLTKPQGFIIRPPLLTKLTGVTGNGSIPFVAVAGVWQLRDKDDTV